MSGHDQDDNGGFLLLQPGESKHYVCTAMQCRVMAFIGVIICKEVCWACSLRL